MMSEYQRKYKRGRKGFLKNLYHRMVSRTRGTATRTPHLYLGLPILSEDEFLSWIDSNTIFNDFFSAWEINKYDRRLTPSVDRIDNSKGYTLDNMQWLTASGNFSKTKRRK